MRSGNNPDDGRRGGSERSRRRGFLRDVGTVAALGGVGSLAGCLGDGAGGGGSGTSVNGGGNTVLKLGFPPAGSTKLRFEYLEERNSILTNMLDEVGYSYEATWSWENASAFAAGKLDSMWAGPPELAKMGAQQDISTVLFGLSLNNCQGLSVAKGSEYSVENTGGAQASVKKLAEDSATLAIDSWAGGGIPIWTMIYEDHFGVTFSQDESSFSVQSPGYSAMPKLLRSGDAAAAHTAPYLPGYIPAILPDIEIVSVFNMTEVLPKIGFSEPIAVSGLAARKSAWDEHQEAFIQYGKALDKSHHWLFENPSKPKEWDNLADVVGQNTQKQGEFYVDWYLKNDITEIYGEDYSVFTYPGQSLFKRGVMTEALAESQKNYLNTVTERGFIEGNWKDHITIHQIAPYEGSPW